MDRGGDATKVGLAAPAPRALHGARKHARAALTASLAAGLALLASLAVATPARAGEAVARVEITSPQSGEDYEQGQPAPSTFTCEALGPYTLESCEDSTGHSGSTGALNTERAGVETYTVTATVNGGAQVQASIQYTVYQRLNAGTTRCTGPSWGAGREVIVVAHAHCTLLPGTIVTGNVHVETAASLRDEGASIAGSLVALAPESIVVGASTPSSIGGTLQITKLAGGPFGGQNSVCNTTIHGNLTVSESLARARPLQIGGAPGCAPDVVHLQLNVLDDAAPVQASDDTVEEGALVKGNTQTVELAEDTFAASLGVSGDRGRTVLREDSVRTSLSAQSNSGDVLVEEALIGQNLVVQNDTGGVQLDAVHVTRNAVCSSNRPAATGTANEFGEHDLGCPV